MMKKIPLDEHGDGNCCPVCGSTQIDVIYQYPLYVCEDLKTGKERFYGWKDGKRVYIPKPSNRMMAARYRTSQVDAQVWNYKCRKCEWLSDAFTP